MRNAHGRHASGAPLSVCFPSPCLQHTPKWRPGSASRLTSLNNFHIIRNMETKDMLTALAALAQQSRLAIFRLLVETRPEGLPLGQLADQRGLANATQAVHL